MAFFDVNTSGSEGRTRLNFASFLITPALGWIWLMGKLTGTDLRYVHGTDTAIAQYETVRLVEQSNAIMLKKFVEYLGRNILVGADGTCILEPEFAAVARKLSELVRIEMRANGIVPTTTFTDSTPATESP